MANERKAITQKALDLLARREHSQRELRQKLQAREFSNREIDDVLATLANEGLQSDKHFAESFLNARASKGYGPTHIANELSQRGVSDELIADALGNTECNWYESAIKVRQKKFSLSEPVDLADRAKQQSFLQYRGFTHEQIRAAVEVNELG